MITVLLWRIIFTSCIEDECLHNQVSMAAYTHETICKRVVIEMVQQNKDVEVATCALQPAQIPLDRIVK